MLRFNSRKIPVPLYHLCSLLLIPIYFITHNFFLYKDEVDFFSLLPHIVGWLILPFIIYFLLGILFGNKKRTVWLITILFMIYYFSFGPVYSFLSSIPFLQILTKLSVILGILFFSIVLIAVLRKRINLEHTRLPQFINTVIIILFFFDVINFCLFDNGLSDNHYNLTEKDPLPPLNSPLKNKPDVYYIFFDELMQTDALRECLQYDNSLLDSALTRRGFFVASESKSAYHATPFSIASAFRSSVFIEKKSKNIHLLDYLIAYKEIQQNLIIPFLIKQGYLIRNFAHYKLFKEESQAMFKDPSYDTRQLVLNQTFSSLIVYLIEGVMSDRFSSFGFQSHEEKEQVISTQKNFINKYQQIIRVSKDKSEKPVFVHGHFFAPHLPVYFDSTGKPLNDQQVNYYKSMTQSVAAYKINLAYTRKLITNLVDEIMKNTNYQAVIIIQSDHGYRGNKKNPVSNEFKFQNFTALYYPDQEYKTLDKKFYLPNTFRYLLNKFSKDSIRLIPPEYIQLSSRFLDD